MKAIRTISLTFLSIMLASIPLMADDISVTVYNSNLGVIHETRTLSFEEGTGQVSFIDVPSQIDATSVGFELVDANKSVDILEQNYAYDLVSPDKIYSKYIDKDIQLFDKEGNIFRGTLLSYSGGAFVIKGNNGEITIIRADKVVHTDFPELPGGLITRPTLFWLYSSDFSGDADCKVSYQTGGISWNAEYVGILSDDESGLNLSGWASINNTSGATYKDATLKLVAGDIHRMPERRMQRPDALSETVRMSAKGFQEKDFFEYHLYTLPRKSTIANNETKQISIFEPATTPVEKEFLYEPQKNATKVRVVVQFENSDKAGLGMPLPEGRVRVFKADDDGSMILLGEDGIDHTAEDEEIKLTVGYAFDIAAEEKVVDYQRLSNKVTQHKYEIELRNHKESDVTITVKKNLYGDWNMIESSHKYEKEDATTVEFTVPVKAKETVKINFTVQTTS